MILNIIEEIRRYQTDLDLFETLIEVFPQSSCKELLFIELMMRILPQSENISAINDCVIVTFCMSAYKVDDLVKLSVPYIKLHDFNFAIHF